MSRLSIPLLESATVVAVFGEFDDAFARMDSAQLRWAVGAIAQLRRHVDQFAALAAGEVAHRSRHELGHQGFAQKAGFVSPVAMLQVEAQPSKHEATRLVEMGTMLAEVDASQRLLDAASDPQGDRVTDPASDSLFAEAIAACGVLVPEWQTILATAVTDGRLSLNKVDAIRRVMTEIPTVHDSAANSVFRATAITNAVIELIESAPHLSPEQLFRHAKQARDVLDADGIARRERQQHDLRSVRTWWDATTGMHCGSWRLAPEDGALVAEAFQQILSPRRGGPRFVHADEKRTADNLVADARTDEQITADAFTAMIRLAVDADPGTLFGSRRPAVRVIVTADRLEKPGGHGHLEGLHEPVSMSTIDRNLCDTGVISIAFDQDGHCVNVGREQRLFTSRQRIGLAARDGGCRFPGCERPPSYSEAHHINPWKAKAGKTDINDGILLCRRHHLLIHSNHWAVSRDGATYWLTPPSNIDPAQQRIEIPTRSPAMEDMRRHRQRA